MSNDSFICEFDSRQLINCFNSKNERRHSAGIVSANTVSTERNQSDGAVPDLGKAFEKPTSKQPNKNEDNKPVKTTSDVMKYKKANNPSRGRNLALAGACLGIIASGAIAAQGQTNSVDSDKMSELEKQNQDLANRLSALEALAKQEGIMPSGSAAPKFVSSVSQMTISGYAQASYFYNFRRPIGGYSAGYLWNTKDNNFFRGQGKGHAG